MLKDLLSESAKQLSEECVVLTQSDAEEIVEKGGDSQPLMYKEDIEAFLSSRISSAFALGEKSGIQKAEEKYADIFAWLFGEKENFPDLSQKPHYSFRSELRKKLASLQSKITTKE